MTASTITSVTSPVLDRSEKQVFITRVFDAPRDLVFKAWTDPCNSCAGTRRAAARSISPGSISVRGVPFTPAFELPNGNDRWCAGVYREIVAPGMDRLHHGRCG